MLARLGRADVERLNPATLPTITDRTLTTRAALLDQLDAIAEQG